MYKRSIAQSAYKLGGKMKDFIFEQELQNLNNNIIRDYLAEVIASYNMGHYRSAVVSLYNVVIYDLMFKLKTLKEVYEDQNASNILEELGNNNTNQSYIQWEKRLFDHIVDHTNLLDEHELRLVERLKEDRNHCAHPAMKDFTIFIPNKDQTRAHLRNMFEIIFLRDPLLAKEIINPILEDIKGYNNTFGTSINPDRFGKYLTSKYYKKLNQKVEKKLFDTLWTFTFIKQGEEFDQNRLACYYALCSLVEMNTMRFLNYVKNDIQFYSKVKINDKDAYHTNKDEYAKLRAIDIRTIVSSQAFLIYFCSEFKEFYDAMKEYLQEALTHEAEKNINLKARAIFMSNSFADHLKAIDEYKKQAFSVFVGSFGFYHYELKDTSVDQEQIAFLCKEAEERNCTASLVDFVIDWINNISSYDSTYKVFQNLVFPVFKYFNNDDVDRMAQIMSNNSQIHGDTRNRNKYIPELKDKITETIGEIGRAHV